METGPRIARGWLEDGSGWQDGSLNSQPPTANRAEIVESPLTVANGSSQYLSEPSSSHQCGRFLTLGFLG